MSEKKLERELEKGKVPGDDIPGHLQEEEHSGAEAIFDMADYALTEEQKIALGITKLDISSPLDEAERIDKAENSNRPE
jgi:hypothetical protein